MKSYADIDYYQNSFIGEKIISDEEEISRSLILASRKIDDITYYRIVKVGFDKLTKFQQEKVREAICFQANYIYENSVETSDIVSYSVIDINVSVGKADTIASRLDMSEMAYSSLKPTGLMSGIL